MRDAKNWQHIAKIIKDLNLPVSDSEVDIGKKMVLVASMGAALRLDEPHYVAYEELTDMICHQLGIVMWLGSWVIHVRACVEKYPIEWFFELGNCELFYFNYKKYYKEVQRISQVETGVRLV